MSTKKEYHSTPCDARPPEGIAEEIILVHGTFAAQPEDKGEAWYQLGSTFVRALEERLPPHIRVTSTVFHWTGENLESHRQIAAARLLRRLLAAADRPVHLVGHSHGGAAIWNMLCLSTEREMDIRNLRSWTTIGTPFLAFNPRRASLLLTLVGWLWLCLSVVWRLLLVLLINLWIHMPPLAIIGFTLFFGVGGWINMLVQLPKLSRSIKLKAANRFGSIGHVLTSTDDEVIPFLTDVLSNRLWQFPRPAEFKTLLDYELYRLTEAYEVGPTTKNWFRYSYGDEMATAQPGYLARNRRRMVRPRGNNAIEEARRQGKAMSIRAGIWWPASLVSTLIGRPAHRVIASMADRMVHSRVVDLLCGNDTLVFRPTSVSPCPHASLTRIVRQLSKSGNKSLVEIANRKAASAVSVARRLLIPSVLLRRRKPSVSEVEAVPLDVFVHTSYFNCEEVLDVIASHIKKCSSGAGDVNCGVVDASIA